ncbi:MAG: MOSC domain-containing protein [Nocardioidaceae bacterium]
MHVSRIGLTPLKGARHGGVPSLDLTLDGPVGDRVFCLVDRSRGRVVRTVENPTLLRTTVDWRAGVLTARLPCATGTSTVEEVPAPTGETLELDYWGRPAAIEVVAGPWAEAYSEHLGYDVEVARAAGPGQVVYGAPVSLVTSSSLERLAEDVGSPVDSARFRATFTLDTPGEPAHVEDGWVGRRVRLGEAEVEVRGILPRCAVVDLDPATGERRTGVLRALGGYRRGLGEVVFGVDAVVTKPGRVAVDDVVGRD